MRLLFRMLRVVTWHGTALTMMRYKGIATSGILSLGRKSLSSRCPLELEAPRKKLMFVEVANVSSFINDDAENKRMQSIKRRWLHHSSKSILACRGGATGKGDKTTTKSSIQSDDVKNLSSSSSSSSDTSSIESPKSTSRNSRTTSPIGSQTYQISVGTEQGFRSYMEDEYYVSNDGDFAAVFDGHGGPAVSQYLRKNLYANVQAFLPLAVLEKQGDRPLVDKDSDMGDKEDISQAEEEAGDDSSSSSPSISSSRRQRSPTVDDYANALESALEKVDSEILKISHWSFQGSTAIVIWFHEDTEERAANNGNESTATQRTILAANIGDSRAVLCRDNKAWDLSRDHKPNDPTEKSRIESFGGSVIWCGETDKFGAPIEDRGIYRVNGNLALSRAIGDRSERPAVTAEPEIISVPVRDGDQFVIVATDGLWDVMDSDDAVNYVKLSLKAGISKNKIADVMVQEAMRLGTYDNVTVVIIWIDSTS